MNDTTQYTEDNAQHRSRGVPATELAHLLRDRRPGRDDDVVGVQVVSRPKDKAK